MNKSGHNIDERLKQRVAELEEFCASLMDMDDRDEIDIGDEAYHGFENLGISRKAKS